MIQNKNNKIHIFGASGSGTTTLGLALSKKLGIMHFDIDDFFWEKTDPPFQKIVEKEIRQKKLYDALQSYDNWVLSGSLCGWGDFIIQHFTLVIFLYVPNTKRMVRLLVRETKNHGEEIKNEGHPMYKIHQDFMAWANQYDTGGLEMRSKKLHEEWMKKLNVNLLKIEGDIELPTVLEKVLKAI
jgi:adenylate kinase family enzyme